MRGHIRKRGKTWAFVMDVGEQAAQRCSECNTRVWVNVTTLRGCPRCESAMGTVVKERRQRWLSGFATRSAAEAEAHLRLAARDNDEDPFPREITFADFT